MISSLRLADVAAQLRQLLATRQVAVSVLDGVCQDAGVSLADVIQHDVTTGAAPSLLLLAASTGDTAVLLALLNCGAKPLLGEDIIASFVQAAASSDRDDVNADAHVSRGIQHLLHAGIEVPPAAGPSRATLICADRKWDNSLNAMNRIDPWAMHYFQSLPASLAAGDRAERQAASHAARIAEGDAAAAVKGVLLLNDTFQLLCAHRLHGFALAHAAARETMHGIIRAHADAGTLQTLVSKAKNLLQSAAETGDADAALAIATAGGKPRSPDVDIYAVLLAHWPNVLDVTGARVGDERLAAYLKQLYNLGVRLDGSDPEPQPSEALMLCAEFGLVHCLRVMVEIIDPHPWGPEAEALQGRTALHVAAAGYHVDSVAYLIQKGWDVYAQDTFALDPLAYTVAEPYTHTACPAKCLDVMAAMTAGMDDVRSLLRSGGMAAQRGAVRYVRTDHVSGRPFRGLQAQAITRMQLHVIAAVRAVPTAPVFTLKITADENDDVCRLINGESLSLFCSEALDAHSADGVYIPDQLRAGGDASDAVTEAVQVDSITDVHAVPKELRADGYDTLSVWRRHVFPDVIQGVSPTLRSWAYMRRVQALWRRRAGVQQVSMMRQ